MSLILRNEKKSSSILNYVDFTKNHRIKKYFHLHFTRIFEVTLKEKKFFIIIIIIVIVIISYSRHFINNNIFYRNSMIRSLKNIFVIVAHGNVERMNDTWKIIMYKRWGFCILWRKSIFNSYFGWDEYFCLYWFFNLIFSYF